jgi:hypothetical protein
MYKPTNLCNCEQRSWCPLMHAEDYTTNMLQLPATGTADITACNLP